MDVSCRRLSGNTPYQLIIRTVPLSTWRIESSPSDRMIIVHIHDPTYKLQPTLEQLKNYFGLTSAQAKIAVRLYSNDSIADASKYLGISINTARSHLRSILAKTGAKTQAELLSLLASTLKTSTGKQH
jgi:DNA-binding CsgD family transcriptional regulator